MKLSNNRMRFRPWCHEVDNSTGDPIMSFTSPEHNLLFIR
jgi:hypothetical protein